MTTDDDDIGNLEISFRVLGNEIVGIRMTVDDFKIKWLVYGLVTIIALGWAASEFGPPLLNMVS